MKHHEYIEQKVNFLVDNAPPKLHEEIMRNRQLMGQVPQQQWVSAPTPAFQQSVQIPTSYAPRQVAVQGSPVRFNEPQRIPAQGNIVSFNGAPVMQKV
ncbi:MAG: hypothetical protein KDD45_17560 [Bdellovibrionales bacterium]|nr:hypothetical protein [Bdellovibrionales bacterium]